MAQAGSAQREPSMEEILASIRRIIEDSDTAPIGEEEAAPDGQDNAEPESALSAEVHSFRDGLKSSNDDPETAEDPAPEPSFQVSGVDGQPNAAASLHEETQQSGEVPGLSDDGPGMADPGERPAEPVAEPSEPQSEAWHSFRRQAPEPEHETATENRPAGDHETDSRPAIISDFTGRKVAAAFEELNGAFEANRRKSFDEMAEEMLRPMLQDWLDNNLPGLVERLVREEIERVARGGSR